MTFFRRQEGRYILRILFIILLTLIGIHSCNVALYNAWMTAFPQNDFNLAKPRIIKRPTQFKIGF